MQAVVATKQEFEVPPSLPFVSASGIVALPSGWVLKNSAFYHVSGLVVLVSEDWIPDGPDEDGDGCVWLHVSLSRRSKLPDWNDLRRVKDAFIGPDRVAVIVLPPEDEYVNHNPNVHHLWCNLDRRAAPDFRRHHPGYGYTL